MLKYVCSVVVVVKKNINSKKYAAPVHGKKAVFLFGFVCLEA